MSIPRLEAAVREFEMCECDPCQAMDEHLSHLLLITSDVMSPAGCFLRFIRTECSFDRIPKPWSIVYNPALCFITCTNAARHVVHTRHAIPCQSGWTRQGQIFGRVLTFTIACTFINRGRHVDILNALPETQTAACIGSSIDVSAVL